MDLSTEYINIHKLIKASDSKLLKRLPDFVIYLIKLIIRQNEINRILSVYANFKGVDFLSKITAFKENSIPLFSVEPIFLN